MLQDISRSVQKRRVFPSYASTDVPLSSEVQNGARVVNRVDTSLKVLSPERMTSSESIFSPTFNPSLAEKKSGQGLKFSFDDDKLVTKLESSDALIGFPIKVLRAIHKSKTETELPPVHSKRIKLKRSSSAKVGDNMPEPKKVLFIISGTM